MIRNSAVFGAVSYFLAINSRMYTLLANSRYMSSSLIPPFIIHVNSQKVIAKKNFSLTVFVQDLKEDVMFFILYFKDIEGGTSSPLSVQAFKKLFGL